MWMPLRAPDLLAFFSARAWGISSKSLGLDDSVVVASGLVTLAMTKLPRPASSSDTWSSVRSASPLHQTSSSI
jgi:hypothetical protein